MDIQFRCGSASYFDQKTGTHRKCNQLLQATSDNVGLKVRCPRCNELRVVPEPAKVSAGKVSGTIDRARQDDVVVSVKSDLSYGKFNKRTRCPKCGSVLDKQKKCTTCRYEAPIVKASTEAIENIKVVPAGFQLWFQSIMSDGTGVKLLAVASHSFVTLSLLGLMLTALFLGGSASIFVIIAGILLGGGYALLVHQAKRLARVPMARVPFYLRPLWNLLMRLGRWQKWQKYDSRLVDRVIIDARGQAYGDRDLLAEEQLNRCQVLDVQGTDITDSSLNAMHGLKHLRCLVVRKTHVTPEAVFRLQQALPRVWIWY